MLEAAGALRVAGILNANDVASINVLNTSVLNTDRCAAESGQRAFIVKAKEKLLEERLGGRFIDAGLSLSLRIAPAGASSVRVEVASWLVDGQDALEYMSGTCTTVRRGCCSRGLPRRRATWA